MNIVYDGSFLGLISALKKAMEFKEEYVTVSKNELLDENIYIETNPADIEYFDKKMVEKLRILYLSEVENLEEVAVGLVKDKPKAERIFDQIRSSFFHSIRRFKAFLRFRKISEGLYCAVFEPEFNIIEFVGAYFFKKMDFDFVIYDKKRRVSFIKKQDKSFIEKMDISFDKDDEVEKLWKSFFNSISIESRRNSKLQKQKVPLKYRKYMSEFTDNERVKL